ncbi:Dehydrogenase citC [Colletotrichum tropicale]|nr:Dehydrogenase citC [Colletotrichum tropicale]
MASTVGGGTAGLTVAARLTENSTTTVLVLQTGADHTSDRNVLAPGLFPAMYENPAYDWDYKTVAQLRLQLCLEIYMTNDNNPPRTTKSSPTQDIDGWGELGNAGWSCEELAPYLRKSAAFVAPSEQQTADMLLGYVDSDSRGTGDPSSMIQSPLLRTWQALGGYVDLLNIAGAARSFAAPAYLGPARQRPNLKVVTGAFVTNIVLKRSGGKVAATGVRWTEDGSTYEATAAREVVLAAGSIASPQLLEVSGISDEKLLRQHGIELDLYIQNRTGRLSSAGASSALLSLKQIASTPDLDRLSLGLKTGKTGLDEQYRLFIRDQKSEAVAQELNREGGISPQLSSDTTKLFPANAQGNYPYILGVLEHPFSRGSVHIQSIVYAVAERAADLLREADCTT